jgi:putative ABC transport system permease protein
MTACDPRPDDNTPRAYLRLLWFYPTSFRRRYSVDMCHTFRGRLAEVRPRGRMAMAFFWARSAVHAFRFGTGERLRAIGGGLPTRAPVSAENGARRLRDRLALAFTDLRLGVRSLRRRPGLAVSSILALGLGIGLTATTFSIAWGTILRGLPFEEADRLVHFERENAEQGLSLAVTPHDYADWRTEQTSFEDLGAYVEALVHLTDGSGTVRRMWGVYIDPQSFDLLRVQPAFGRGLSPEDAVPGAPDVILLSHLLWETDFGGDPGIVGSTIDLNGGPATVIGVMPEGFGFPIAEQFWRPLRLDFSQLQRGDGRLDVFGRLAPGVDFARARAEFRAIGDRLARAFPATNEGLRPVLRTFREEYVGPEFSRLVYAMLAGAVLVLLIACANVSNLLAARAMTRTREVAVRRALGAGRSRILAQFLAETAVLSGIGALVGIGLARIGVTWFAAGARAGAFRLPHGSDSLFWWNLEFSWAPIVFVLVVTVLTGILAATAPAARVLGTDVGEILKDEGRGGSGRRLSGFMRAVVVAEIALTTSLIVAAGLMVKSVVNATAVEPALDGDGVLTARLALPLAALGLSEERYLDHASRLAFHERLLAELDAGPAAAVAITSALPTSLGGGAAFEAQDGAYQSDEDYPDTRVVTVSPGFFETFGVSLRQGREFADTDRAGGAPVAIVNESFVERHFAGESPLFRQIRLRDDDGLEPWLTIVGVTPTLVSDDDPQRDLSRVFLPLAQSGLSPNTRLGRWGLRFMTVAVRTTGDAGTLAGTLREAVRRVDPTVPAYEIETFEAVLARAAARYRIFGRYYLVFGIAALALSVIGLYSIMSFAVANRQAEIGIRLALGARGGDVLRQVLGEGLRQVALGLAIGAVLAIWVTSGLSRVLYQVERWDPAIALATVTVIVVTGLMACLIPARRAAAIDPTSAMRRD